MKENYSAYIGKSFLYKGKNVTITDVIQSGENNVKVFMGKEYINISKIDLKKDFVLVETPGQKQKALTKYEGFDDDNKTMTSLSAVLLDNIEKIKADEKFIPKAVAINEQAKTLIALQAVKIKTIQMLKQ